MHPRSESRVPADDINQEWSARQQKQAQLLLKFVQERGSVHPREVDEHFAHGTVKNYWGGSSNATTHLLDAMHYRGLLRVMRREKGIRIYGPYQHAPAPESAIERQARIDALIDVADRIKHQFLKRCACWRLSIQSCTTARASSCCGDGLIVSKPTRPQPNVSLATTPCHCFGATG